MKSASSVCIRGYTFRMKSLIWLLSLGIAAGVGYWLWSLSRKWEERKRAAEERFATFMAQTMKPAAPKLDPVPAPAIPAAVADLGPQKLLLEAAAKAGDAGEPALSIQLYARLIARYPDGAFAAQACAAVEAQKSKLARP
jgi:hypothetical protein